MKGMKTFVLGFFCLAMPWLALAEGQNFGNFNNFKESIGGRASGMAGAFTAAADNVSSAYWNPAGLSGMELYTYEVEMQHAFVAEEIGINYAGYAFNVPNIGNYGISWLNYTVGGFEQRNSLGEAIGDYDSLENILILSYGSKFYDLIKGFSAGINLKLLQYSLEEASALGYGLDLGIKWQPVLYWDHTLGLSVQNLFQNLYWKNGSVERSQVHLTTGLALRFFSSDDALYFNHLITTMDLDFSEDNTINLRTGIEYWFVKYLGIRAGYNNRKFTMGVSYAPEFYELDYAYHYDLTVLGNNQHILAVTIRLK